MEITCNSVMPPKHPWLVAQDMEADQGDLIFYNIHDQLSHYRCQIPELVGKRIRGCFHVCWVLLSSNHPRDVIWSLWNPVTSNIINLPPLNHKGPEDDISYSCLSAPPDDPNSVLLLMRARKPYFVCCRLGHNANELNWVESTYANQIKMITRKAASLHYLTCCNGKVYAYIKYTHNRSTSALFIVEVRTAVNNDCKSNKLIEEDVVITLLPVLEFFYFNNVKDCPIIEPILKGSSTELFLILIGINDKWQAVSSVHLFKLDMNNMTWEQMEDLKDTILSVKLGSSDSSAVFCSQAVATSAESGGGYIHILINKGSVISSYHVKDKTISLSCIHSVAGTNPVSAWAIMHECTTRLDGDHRVHVDCVQEKEAKSNFPNGVLKMKEFCIGFECLKLSPLPYVVGYKGRLESDDADSKQKDDKDVDIVVRSIEGDGDDESHLFKLPSHVLEMLIMEFCVSIEYLKFRSTCKHCHLSAPLMPWKASMRLQNYSLLSPWMIVFDKPKGIITLTDPMFGDNYFIKTPKELDCGFQIKCSRDGWLLILRCCPRGSLVFFNPFTSDIIELPLSPATDIVSFSAPPTSSDCMVAGITSASFHIVGREPPWRRIHLDVSDNKAFSSVAFHGRDVYALRDDGGLDVIKNMGREDCYISRYAAQAPPTSCCSSVPQCFQVICDQHILRVIVGIFGESVEVFKIKSDVYAREWEKLDSLGKRVIFICGTSSFCLDAKTPQMENKIYFPTIPIMYYSLETCRFHTCNNKNIPDSFVNFFGTKHYLGRLHGWIEPRWS